MWPAGGGRHETVLAEQFDGKQLNAPNDLTIDRQGRIYFTDIAAPPEGTAGVGQRSLPLSMRQARLCG